LREKERLDLESWFSVDAHKMASQKFTPYLKLDDDPPVGNRFGIEQAKGDTSSELSMGTFLTKVDSSGQDSNPRISMGVYWQLSGIRIGKGKSRIKEVNSCLLFLGRSPAT
jgi:hypothetical protein